MIGTLADSTSQMFVNGWLRSSEISLTKSVKKSSYVMYLARKIRITSMSVSGKCTPSMKLPKTFI